MSRSLQHRLTLSERELKGAESQLRALSPYAVLERGYSVAHRADGKILRDASELRVGDLVTVRFARGAAKATVTETTDEEFGEK